MKDHRGFNEAHGFTTGSHTFTTGDNLPGANTHRGISLTKNGIYVLHDDTHLSRWIEEHGRLDIAEGEIERYKKYIPRGGVVVDAGASLGDHTLTYSKLVGSIGRVYAFEPNPLARVALWNNMRRQGNVYVFNQALSDEDGGAQLIIQENAGASYIGEGEGVTVNMAKLDTIYGCGNYNGDTHECFIHERCDFIHLDCEGYETKALVGAKRVLEKFKPAIVLEINHECLERNGLKEADVLNLLDELGYHWQELEPGHGSHLPQRDILALPK